MKFNLIKDLLNSHPDVKEAVQFDPAEYDEEGSMAKISLRTVIAAAKELHDMLSDDENLPEWAQAKLVLAEDYMISVRDYMKHRSEAQPKNPRDIEPLTEFDEEDNHYLDNQDEYDGDDESTHNGPFFVVFHNTDNNRTWIGKVEKVDSKWHEKPFKGTPDSRWGGTYMGYMQHDDIMSWIHKDYGDCCEISGPFDSAEAAEGYHQTMKDKHSAEARYHGMTYDKYKNQIENMERAGGYLKDDEISEEMTMLPPIEARQLYTQTYMKHGKTIQKSKKAEEMAYDAVEKKFGKDVLEKLKKFHFDNQNRE